MSKYQWIVNKKPTEQDVDKNNEILCCNPETGDMYITNLLSYTGHPWQPLPEPFEKPKRFYVYDDPMCGWSVGRYGVNGKTYCRYLSSYEDGKKLADLLEELTPYTDGFQFDSKDESTNFAHEPKRSPQITDYHGNVVRHREGDIILCKSTP